MTFLIYLLASVLVVVGAVNESLFPVGLVIGVSAFSVSALTEIYGILPKRTTNAKKLF